MIPSVKFMWGTSRMNLTKGRGLSAQLVTQMNSAIKDLFAGN
jgi:hypothetical protein